MLNYEILSDIILYSVRLSDILLCYIMLYSVILFDIMLDSVKFRYMILYNVRREKTLRLSRDSRGWVCSQGSCQAPSARVPRELQSLRITTAYRESVSPTGSPTDMLRLSHAKTQTTSKYITIGSALWHQRYLSSQGFGNS